MASFLYGEKSKRPGTYKRTVNIGNDRNLFGSDALDGIDLITVELFVMDEVLYATGPAFSTENDETMIGKKITRPKVRGETLTIKSSV